MFLVCGAGAQLALSRLNLGTGNADAARQYAEQAKKAAPTNLAAAIVLAQSLLAQGDLPRAGTEIASLVARAPDSSAVQSLDAALEERRGHAAAARAAFERAFELSPSNLEAIAGLVRLDLREHCVCSRKVRIERDGLAEHLLGTLVLSSGTVCVGGECQQVGAPRLLGKRVVDEAVARDALVAGPHLDEGPIFGRMVMLDGRRVWQGVDLPRQRQTQAVLV